MATDTTTKRGRPFQGSVKRGPDGLWRVRIPVPGTKRSLRRKLGPEITSEERAREVARYWYEKLLEDPGLLDGDDKPLTCAEYLDRWTADRARRYACADADKAAILLHVLDRRDLRDKPCTDVTADDLRAVVARLDRRVQADEIEATTARRIWSKVRVMFVDMAEHKVPALRVRTDNIAPGVRPPDRGIDKDKTTLYPDEAAQLLACKDVPLAHRRVWALLLYTGLRVSELRALKWASVDLRHQQIHVHQSGDQDSDDATKTGKGRIVQIVPALLPLLDAMAREAVVPNVVTWIHTMPSSVLRTHLRVAGLTREALFTTDKTRRALRAQDARATTATWLGLAMQLHEAGLGVVGRRVDPETIQGWLGHDDYKTTQRHYLRGKSLRVEAVGTPFAPLPADLLGPEPTNSRREFTSDDAPSMPNVPEHFRKGAPVSSHHVSR